MSQNTKEHHQYSTKTSGSGNWQIPIALHPQGPSRGAEYYEPKGVYTGTETLSEPVTIPGPDPNHHVPVHSNQDGIDVGDETGAVGMGMTFVTNTARQWSGEKLPGDNTGTTKDQLTRNLEVEGGYPDKKDVPYHGLAPGSASPTQ